MPVEQVSTFEDFKAVLLDDSQNGREQHGKKYVFVDFFAPWCGPCRRFAPKLDMLSDTYNENIHYLKVDIDEVEEVGHGYEIKSLPTFMVFETGSLKTRHSPVIGANPEVVESKLKQLEAGPLQLTDDF